MGHFSFKTPHLVMFLALHSFLFLIPTLLGFFVRNLITIFISCHFLSLLHLPPESSRVGIYTHMFGRLSIAYLKPDCLSQSCPNSWFVTLGRLPSQGCVFITVGKVLLDSLFEDLKILWVWNNTHIDFAVNSAWQHGPSPTPLFSIGNPWKL